jgi:hypothetical protein
MSAWSSKCFDFGFPLLGMPWGVSWNAVGIAKQELGKISVERWYYYFEKVIQNDNIILGKMENDQIERFSNFLTEYKIDDFENLPKLNQILYNAIVSRDGSKARNTSRSLLSKMNG